MECQCHTRQECDNCGGAGTSRCAGCGDAYYCGRECQSRHWKSSHKNVCVRQPREVNACGLCGNKRGPFMKTPCCNKVICDSEEHYQLNSYQRIGQCARNHRYHSICAFHHNERHGASWKECGKCKDFFHPFDYAVKAVSQARSGTFLKYNFDDNVRTDLNPLTIPMPQCSQCSKRVNTTEENTRTLMMRKMFNSPVVCVDHGYVFGQSSIMPGDFPSFGKK